MAGGASLPFGLGLRQAVHLHQDAQADRQARFLAADAFALGTHIAWSRQAPALGSPAGAGLLAHELTHVQEQLATRPRVQSSPADFLSASLTPEFLRGVDDDELLQGIALMADQAAGLPADAPQARALAENFAVAFAEAADRGLPPPDRELDFLRIAAGPLAAWAVVDDLRARIDAMVLLLADQLPTLGVGAARALEALRPGLAWLTPERCQAVSMALDQALTTFDEVARIDAAIPSHWSDAAPPAGELLGAAYGQQLHNAWLELREQMQAAADGAYQEDETRDHHALLQARDAYLDAFSRDFTHTARRVQATLPVSGDIPYADNFAHRHYFWPGAPAEWADYQLQLAELQHDFQALGDLADLPESDMARRVAFLADHGQAIVGLIARARLLDVARATIATCAVFVFRVHDMWQMQSGDEALWYRLRGLAGSSLRALAAGDVSAEVAGEAEEQLKAFEKRAQSRLEDLEALEAFMAWTAGLASIFVGGLAMEFVVARLAVAGGRLAGAGMAMSGARFVVGSLTFTGASTLTRGALTGHWPTAGELGSQAALDLVTLGTLRGARMLVGLRYGAGVVPPAAAVHGTAFAVMWAWQAGLTFQGDAAARASPGAVLETLVRTGARTAIDMVALHVAHSLLSMPTTGALGATLERDIQADWQRLQARATRTGEGIQEWMRSARDPAELGRLMREAREVVRGAGGVYRRMADAGLITRADLEALETQGQGHLRSLENLEQAGRLGILQVGESMFSYNGSPANVAHYLERLSADGVLEGVEARGDTFSARQTDGRLVWFYPQGSAMRAPVDVTDFNAQAVERAAPDASAHERAAAMQALQRLPMTELARVTAQLQPGPAATAMVRWLAAPGAAEALAPPQPLLNAQRFIALLNDATLLERMTIADRDSLVRWWHAGYERVGGVERTVETLLEFTRLVEATTGSAQVADAAAAAAMVERLAEASEVRELRPEPPYRGPSMSAPDTPASPSRSSSGLRSRIGEYLAGRGLAGQALLETRIDDQTWVLQMQADLPSRAWRFGAGGALVEEVDIGASLRSLEAAAARLEGALASGDRVAAAAAVDGAAPTRASLAFLQRTRGIELRPARQLLDRVDAGRLGPPAPASGPVTRSESAGLRRDALVTRAARMGLPREPSAGLSAAERRAVSAIETVRGRNPRGASVDATLANIEGELLLAENALDTLARAALERTASRIGAEAMARVRRDIPLDDRTLGEVLQRTHRLHGFGPGPLRGLLLAAAPGVAGEPISPDRLLEAAPSAAERSRVLETYARLRDAGVPGTHEVLQSMLGSRNSWRGGVWQLDFVRDHVGFDRVERFEVTERDIASGRVRRYDVVLRGGIRLELKDWSHFFESSLRSQFRRDIALRTRDFTWENGVFELQWVFRGPGPSVRGSRTPAELQAALRAIMREELVSVMAENRIPEVQRQFVLEVFDAHEHIVRVVDTGVTRPPGAAP